MKKLKTDTEGTLSYTHHGSIDEMYDALVEVTKKELEQERENAYHFFNIQADEATDSANLSVLVTYISFVNNKGDVVTRYLSTSELQGTTSDHVHEALEKVLIDNNLLKKNMVGLATDGASVMRGCKKGVATKFQNELPHLVTSHCMAHRLQLAAEKAANEVPYLIKYIGICNQLAKALKFSPKLCRMFEAAKEMNEEQARKIKQVFFTRWLSFQDTVQALCASLSSVLSCLYAAAAEKGLEGRAVMHGLCNQMATYKFAACTFFLADAIGLLGLLSTCLQKRNETYLTHKESIDATVTALLALETTPGPYYSQFLEEVKEACPSGNTPYKCHELKDGPKQREDFAKLRKEFLEALTSRLSGAFPDNEKMEAFRIFDPSSFHIVSDPKAVVHELYEQYSDYITCEEDLLTEMAFLKPLLVKHEKTMSHEDFFKRVIHPKQGVIPNVAALASIGLSIPTTSVECERGISVLNSIKSDSRSRMSVPAADKLSLLAIEGKALKDFDLDAAFEVWATMKNRWGLKKMPRE